jgi:hypothetical protein
MDLMKPPRRFRFAIFILCMLGLACGLHAEHDVRIKAMLDRHNLPYEMVEGGDFGVTLSLGNGRTHLVYIKSETIDLNGILLREIWSPAAFSEEGFPPEVMRNALNDAGLRKATAWKFVSINGMEALVCFTKVRADMSEKELFMFCGVVMGVADSWEEVLTQADDL